jgi:hypothetical protein
MKDMKKRNIIQTVFCFATLLLALAAVASAQNVRTCPFGSPSGHWGYTWTGTIILPTGPVPAAALGRSTLDDEGKFTSTQTSVVGGQVSDDTVKGTYTTNPDCTGTMTASVYDKSGKLLRTAIWATVADDNGRESRSIMTSLVVVLPDGTSVSVPAVITMNSTRQFPRRER